jgi:hypothetical protein
MDASAGLEAASLRLQLDRDDQRLSTGLHLVLLIQRNREAMCRQTSCLAPMGSNCDQIATKPHVTARDGCPALDGYKAVDQDQRGREGMKRTGGDG